MRHRIDWMKSADDRIIEHLEDAGDAPLEAISINESNDKYVGVRFPPSLKRDFIRDPLEGSIDSQIPKPTFSLADLTLGLFPIPLKTY